MKTFLIFTSVFFLLSATYAQKFVCSETDSVIFKAMKDEMDRSMTEYNNPEAGKFFYIMYQIDDGQSLFASASLGSLLNSYKKIFRNKGYRIMMGNYNFNDENFIRSSRDFNNQSLQNNIKVPLDNDYMGIRRSLWAYTDIAYSRCIKSYLDKKAFFKKNPELFPEIPDYTKIDSTEFLRNSDFNLLDKKKAEVLVKDISNVFRNYDKIVESLVTFNQIIINVYLLSTEGVKVKIPLNYSLLSVKVSALKDSLTDKKQSENLTYYDVNPENLIQKIDKIKTDAEKLANYTIAIIDAEELEEDYDGPVILSDRATSNFFYKTMFGSDINIIATRESVYENPKWNYLRKKDNLFEKKIGEFVIPKEFSVIDRSKLTSYKNKKLLGTTLIDQEGVVPPDELELIKDGRLITLFNDRIPTVSVSKSNGHKRLGVSATSSITKIAPSNLFIEYSKGVDFQRIEKLFYKLCKEDELEYGIIIKSLIPEADYSPFVYYKVFKDGKEQLIKNLSFPHSDKRSLKKIEACTSEQYISNKLIGSKSDGFLNMNLGLISSDLTGCFSGIVTPSSILIKDIELNKKENSLNWFD